MVFVNRAISQASSNYFSTVFNKDIRYYFDVDNQYVISKLLVILFPFAYKVNIFILCIFTINLNRVIGKKLKKIIILCIKGFYLQSLNKLYVLIIKNFYFSKRRNTFT